MRALAWFASAAFATAGLSGCGGSGGGSDGNLVDPPTQGENPEVGCYDFSARGCFAVDVENPGTPTERKVVYFAADCASPDPASACVGQRCFRSQRIAVNDGGFLGRKGDVAGTDCPTDGYQISGSFVTARRAEGDVAYIRSCLPSVAIPFVAEMTADTSPSPQPTAGCTCTPAGCVCGVPPIGGRVCNDPPR